MSLDRSHRRSLGFVDHDSRTWACFLVTFEDRDRRWHGYVSFRSGDGELAVDDVRTADIFLGDTEGEIQDRAQGFGRTVLTGLLASALETRHRNGGGAPGLRSWFRSMLAERSRTLGGRWDEEAPEGEPPDPAALRGLYTSYRLDQVAHFIALVPPADFQHSVDRILEGETGTSPRDRTEQAMEVVRFIERRLPLPPFEIWSRDFLLHRAAYRLYAHTLHIEGRLP